MAFRDVLSPTEVESALRLLWADLGSLGTGIERGQPSTWHGERWPGGDGGVGLISAGMEEYGFTHSSFCWYCRGVPAVKAAFAAIHGTDDLEVSFAGVALMRPWALEPAWQTESGWLHLDRSAVGFPGASVDRPTFVQGFINLLPTHAGSGGNCIVPRFHKKYAGLVAEFSESGREFRDELLAEERPELVEGAMVPHLEAGDLFLWDVRLPFPVALAERLGLAS